MSEESKEVKEEAVTEEVKSSEEVTNSVSGTVESSETESTSDSANSQGEIHDLVSYITLEFVPILNPSASKLLIIAIS